MTTPKLGLDEIAESQSNKYATHNEALRGVDALLPKVAISVRHTPPGSPANGDVYIISDGSPTATGAWAGQDGDIAWYNGEWNFVTPEAGWTVYVQGDSADWLFDGSTWSQRSYGTNGVTLEDEGSTVTGGPHTTLNFTGDGVTVTDAGSSEATINVTGGGGGGVSASVFSGVHLTQTADQTLSDSTNTALQFDTVVYDTDGYSSVGSPDTSVRVPETGYYHIEGFVRWDANSTGGRIINIVVDGDVYTRDVIDCSSTLTHGQSVTADLYLTANSVVYILVFQNSGGNLNTRSGNGTNADYARFSITKLAGIGGVQATFSGVRVTRSTNQTVANSTADTLQFETADYDTDNYFVPNGSPDSVIVIPENGYYHCAANVFFDSNATGRRSVQIRRNGTDIIASAQTEGAPSGAAHGSSVSTIAYFAEGNTVNVNLFHNSGGNLDVIANGEYPNLSVTRITASGVTLDNEGLGSPSITDQYHNIAIGSGLNLEHLGDGLARISVGESGTWTPTIQDGSFSDAESQAYTTQNGSYYRVGRLVHVDGRILTSSLGTLSGGLYIAGLPFAAATPDGTEGATLNISFASGLAITASESMTLRIVGDQTYAAIYVWDATTGTTQATTTEWTADGQIIFSGTYMTDD